MRIHLFMEQMDEPIAATGAFLACRILGTSFSMQLFQCEELNLTWYISFLESNENKGNDLHFTWKVYKQDADKLKL